MVSKRFCDYCNKEIAAFDGKEPIFTEYDGGFYIKDSCADCHSKRELIKEKYGKKFKNVKNQMNEEIINMKHDQVIKSKPWWKFW